MEREIKFRAWITEYYPFDSVQNTMLPHDELSIDGALDGHEAGNVILMQYTGLKDKNGTEIYEGDILTHNSKTEYYAIVEWSYGPVFKWTDNFDTESFDSFVHNDDVYEVIGNIFENPELLEQKVEQ